MKIFRGFSLVFLFVVQYLLYPQLVMGQTTSVSMEMKNVPIEEVLNHIETNTTYRFLYNRQLVDVTSRISVSCENKEVSLVLTEIFKGTGIDFNINGRQIVLNKIQNPVVRPPVKVSGTITDKWGETIIGATIQVKGTMTGTTSDLNGLFSLEPPAGSVLSVSFIGYKTLEFLVDSDTVLNISMEEDVEILGEVVVTALGIRREEKALGYAVQKVSGSDLQTVKGVDVGTSLTGRIAGLLVFNSTEFAQAPDILIRGERPLLVVDGVPFANMTLRDIPSDDIETIDVLKGATASALYGFRGSSGAIMVTTKRGSKIKGLSVTINNGNLFNAGYLAIPEMQSSFGRVVNTATNRYSTGGDGSWGVPLDGREVIQWDPVSKSWQAMPYLPRGKDNFRNFLEQGYVLNNNVNLVQQGEFGSFRTSATWVQNKGQYPNSVFDKYTYSIGGDMKIDKFSLSSSLSYNKQASPHKGFSGYTSYDPMYTMLIWSAPDYDIRDYRDYWVVPDETQNNSYTDSSNNPYFDRFERIHKVNKDIFQGSLSLSYDLTPWLGVSMRSGFDTYSDRQDVRISKGSLISAGSSYLIPNGRQVWGESFLGSFNTGISKGYSLNNDLIVTSDYTFFDKFTVEGLVGGTVFYRQDEGIESFTIGGLTIPGFYSLKASVNPAEVNSNLYRQQVNSLFGRLALSWGGIAYLEGTFRNDWSSTLPETTRSYLYPAVSASFIVSELLPKINWLSFWKLRSSWTTSKTPAGIYQINNVFSINNNVWGSLSSASYPTTIRGADVRPQTSTTYEVGTALNFLNNRASLDVSYYAKRMFDALRSTGISSASGYSYNYINIDEEITRKGVEVITNITPVKTNDLRWDVSLNWSKYARFYTKLDSLYSEDSPWVAVGERADAYVLRDYLKDSQGNTIHNNGLPLYSAYYSRYGYSDPDWIWGFNTQLKYKNLQVGIAMDGRVGGLAQTTTEMYMWRAGSHPNSVVPERFLDATNPGTANYLGNGVKVISGSVSFDTYGNIIEDTRVYAPNDIKTTYENYMNELHKGTAWGGVASPVDVYSTTFLKIREVSLTYTLPEQWVSKVKAREVSISAVGQNVLLWAKQFRYSDPDGGYDNFSDPSLRVLGFNVKVVF